jgi:hypothetical protein
MQENFQMKEPIVFFFLVSLDKVRWVQHCCLEGPFLHHYLAFPIQSQWRRALQDAMRERNHEKKVSCCPLALLASQRKENQQ